MVSKNANLILDRNAREWGVYPSDEPQAVMCFRGLKFSYSLFGKLEKEHDKRRKTRMLETVEGRK